MTGSARQDAAPGGRAPGLGPVAAVSRREGVMREIRRAIVLGTLHSGEKLTETGLSEALGVSRPTVREALARLVNEGFLEAEPYRGIRVASLSAEEMVSAARVRMTLDALAIEMILEDESGARLERLREAWRDFERDIAAEDPLARHEAHVRFHRRLWEASGNTMLAQYWPVTEARITLQLAEDQRLASDLARDVEVHRRVVEAIERAAQGDRSALAGALEEHTMGSVRALIAGMHDPDVA